MDVVDAQRSSVRNSEAVDRIARRWKALEAQRERLRRLILRLARSPRAERRTDKTRVLAGQQFEIQITRAVETLVDQAVATRIWPTLPAGLRRKILERRITFTVRPGAEAIVLRSVPGLRRRWLSLMERRARRPAIRVERKDSR